MSLVMVSAVSLSYGHVLVELIRLISSSSRMLVGTRSGKSSPPSHSLCVFRHSLSPIRGLYMLQGYCVCFTKRPSPSPEVTT